MKILNQYEVPAWINKQRYIVECRVIKSDKKIEHQYRVWLHGNIMKNWCTGDLTQLFKVKNINSDLAP